MSERKDSIIAVRTTSFIPGDEYHKPGDVCLIRCKGNVQDTLFEYYMKEEDILSIVKNINSWGEISSLGITPLTTEYSPSKDPDCEFADEFLSWCTYKDLFKTVIDTDAKWAYVFEDGLWQAYEISTDADGNTGWKLIAEERWRSFFERIAFIEHELDNLT